ncbi:hypothetical protein GCM10023340_10070 [Nocardioides marinquilinus]|uniref:BatC protein n=1 Tax=Nocardioides marinquilinus TaxID=1210400 RepID=A0ABP9PBP0_9ACTN
MSENTDEGQVSEAGSSGMGGAPEEISDSQGVAGNPDAPDADDVEAGPNANPHAGEDTH